MHIYYVYFFNILKIAPVYYDSLFAGTSSTDAVLEKVEVDPLNRKLFYTDTGNDVIAVMNLDGTGYQQIVTTDLDEPRDIVLDPRNQFVHSAFVSLDIILPFAVMLYNTLKHRHLCYMLHYRLKH